MPKIVELPVIRVARKDDLGSIITMLADDPLGKLRENTSEPLDQRYQDVFAIIEADENQLLRVVEIDAVIAGCIQLTLIPGLSRTGMWRGQIESVRIATGFRDRGLGQMMIEWAIEKAREKGCGLVQLTSDKQRGEAIKFYQKLGFVASHEGLKLNLGE